MTQLKAAADRASKPSIQVAAEIQCHKTLSHDDLRIYRSHVEKQKGLQAATEQKNVTDIELQNIKERHELTLVRADKERKISDDNKGYMREFNKPGGFSSGSRRSITIANKTGR